MDTKQLAYFIAVAKYRNFSRAAEEFYISQPAVSHQIKMLERELKTDLFVRNTKKVTLTESGALFLEDAKSILASVNRAKERLLQTQKQPAVLRICHLAAATHSFLPDVVNQFHIRYPHIKIRLIRQDAYLISESVLHREADIYFSIMEDLLKYTFLEVEKIQTDSFCLVTRKDHPALKQGNIDFNQLEKEPFLVFYPEHAQYLNKQITELCDQLDFYPEITERFDLYENLLQAVEAGTGISILPYQSRDYIHDDKLAFTLLGKNQNTLDLAMAWERESANPTIALFLALFRNYMKDIGSGAILMRKNN